MRLSRVAPATTPAADILDADDGLGLYDYIIAHGVYSWVPRHVRRRILEICAENLAPQGVGYVSYNALPGWHLRQPVRDLIGFHTAACSSSHAAVEAARDILALTVESHDGRQSAYAELMRDEYHILSSLPDGYLYHEMMEKTNEPMYFRDFIQEAEHLGLQYLGEASVLPMLTDDLPQRVRELRTVGRLVALHKRRERRFLSGGKPWRLRGSLYNQPLPVHLGVTHTLGYMLGERIFGNMLEGLISKAAVRDLFYMNFSDLDQAFTT